MNEFATVLVIVFAFACSCFYTLHSNFQHIDQQERLEWELFKLRLQNSHMHDRLKRLENDRKSDE